MDVTRFDDEDVSAAAMRRRFAAFLKGFGLRLRGERGMTLVLALGVMVVLSVSAVAVIDYTSSNSRTSAMGKTDKVAFSLAEAGMNNAYAVLNNTSNNSLDPDVLPSRTTYYDGGRVVWSGTLDRAAAVWTVTATGYSRNPTGPNGTTEIKRTLSSKVSVVPTLTQPLNNPAWNYIYSKRTGNACDQTFNNNVNGSSRLYVEGNLCLGNNAVVAQSSIIIKGNLDLANGNTAVGANTNMSTRVETYVGGSCRFGGGTWATPCTGNQDSRHIYSKLADGTTIGVSGTPPLVAAPTADFAGWYENAIPGPSQGCTTVSGTPPTFDNDYPNRNNSVATSFELTPTTSYTCRVGPAGSPSGELSWNASTKVLTVSGTIFIDGSVKITNGALNSYTGLATLYVSGSFYLDGKLCGGISGSDCNFASWNPNSQMLTFVVNGDAGQAGVNTGRGIQFANNAEFQGGLFATNAIELGNNTKSDGPMVGSDMIFNNNVANDAFPTITVVPVGMPGNPAVYAQPNPPQSFAG
jgi:hypothetical protein